MAPFTRITGHVEEVSPINTTQNGKHFCKVLFREFGEYGSLFEMTVWSTEKCDRVIEFQESKCKCDVWVTLKGRQWESEKDGKTKVSHFTELTLDSIEMYEEPKLQKGNPVKNFDINLDAF